MVSILQTPVSCGARVIIGIHDFNPTWEGDDIKRRLREYIRMEVTRRRRIGDGGGTRSGTMGFIFSDIANSGGERLANFLESEEITDEVSRTPSFINYNTGSKIVIYAFSVNKAWWTARIRRATKR